MVRLTGPLFSYSASGGVGEALTYSKRKGTHQVRFQRKQKDYENAARTTARDPFRWGIELWNVMPGVEKDYWKEVARWGYANV